MLRRKEMDGNRQTNFFKLINTFGQYYDKTGMHFGFYPSLPK
jgi:hypothetical protein